MNGLAWRSQVAATGLSVLLLVAASTVVTAQNPPAGRAASPPRASAPPPAPTAPPAPVAPAPSAQLPASPAPAAQPQAEAPPQPEPTRTEILKFDNWVLTCNEFAEGPRTRVCSALTRAYNQQNKQLVFQWTFAVDNNKQLVTVIETLPGVAILPGIELRIGKSAAHKIPYVTCETGVCVARSNVDANLLRDLTGSPTAEVVIQGSQGNTLQFPVPLKGFERG